MEAIAEEHSPRLVACTVRIGIIGTHLHIAEVVVVQHDIVAEQSLLDIGQIPAFLRDQMVVGIDDGAVIWVMCHVLAAVVGHILSGEHRCIVLELDIVEHLKEQGVAVV